MARAGAALLVLAACACGPDTAIRGVREDAGPGWTSAPPAGPEVRVDRITQAEVPAVDLLWVVDNSASMAEEQSSLAGNFSSFAEAFVASQVDWRLGVISTDMDDPAHRGRLRQADGFTWIEPDDADAAQLFARMVSVGTSGHYEEAGFDAIFAALVTRADDHNAGFRRPEAALEVVVVSDEDDASTLGLGDFVDWYDGLALEPGGVGFSAIVTPLEGCETGGAPGLAYLAVTRIHGGVQGAVCSLYWGNTIGDIGDLVAGRVREFFLSARPDPETLAVAVESPGSVEELDAGEYRYDPDRNSVLLVVVPEPGDVVVLTYEVAEENRQ